MKLPEIHSPTCKYPMTIDQCACGMNSGCLTCNWGRGAIPCDCSRVTTDSNHSPAAWREEQP